MQQFCTPKTYSALACILSIHSGVRVSFHHLIWAPGSLGRAYAATGFLRDKRHGLSGLPCHAACPVPVTALFSVARP